MFSHVVLSGLFFAIAFTEATYAHTREHRKTPDLIRVLGGSSPNWQIAAYYTLIGRIIGALVAAVPGFIDMLSLPSGPKRTALVHMAINLTVVALYVWNAYLRKHGGLDFAVWLSAIAVGLLAVSGWLGGKMVYVHGVAVDLPPQPAPTRRQRAPM